MAHVPESPKLSPSPFTQTNSQSLAWPALPETPWPQARTGVGLGSCHSSFDATLHEIPETPLPITVTTPPCRLRQPLLPETLLRTHRPQSDSNTPGSLLHSFPETPLLTHTQQYKWNTSEHLLSLLPRSRRDSQALTATVTRRTSIPQTSGFEWCTTPAPKSAQSPASLPRIQLASDSALPTIQTSTATAPNATISDPSATDHTLDHWFIPETQSPGATPTKSCSALGELEDAWLELPQTQLTLQLTPDTELDGGVVTPKTDGYDADKAKLVRPAYGLSQDWSPKSFTHPCNLSLTSQSHQPTPDAAQGASLVPRDTLVTPCPTIHPRLLPSTNEMVPLGEQLSPRPVFVTPAGHSDSASQQSPLTFRSLPAEMQASRAVNDTDQGTRSWSSPDTTATTPHAQAATSSSCKSAPKIETILCDTELCHPATPLAADPSSDVVTKRSLSPSSVRVKVEDAQTPVMGQVDQLIPASTPPSPSASLVTPKVNRVELKTPTSILTDCTPPSQQPTSAHRLSGQGHRCTQLAFDWQRTMAKRKIRLTAKPTEWVDAFADPSPPAPLQCKVHPTPHHSCQETLVPDRSGSVYTCPAEKSPRVAKLSSVTRVFLSPRSRRCFHCGTTSGRQWRRGPDGPKTLCNPCGLWYLVHKRLPGHLAKLATPRIGPSTPVGQTSGNDRSNQAEKIGAPSNAELTHGTKRPRLFSPHTHTVPEQGAMVPALGVAVNFPSPVNGHADHPTNEAMDSAQANPVDKRKRPRRTISRRNPGTVCNQPKRRTKRSQTAKAPLELGQSPCPPPSRLFTAMKFLVTYPPATKEPVSPLDTADSPPLPRPKLEALLQELGGQVISSGTQAVQRFLTLPVVTDADLQNNSATTSPTTTSAVPLPSIMLISPCPSRTLKYLLALAVGIPCVQMEWVLDAQRQGQVPDYRRYRLPSGHSAWTQQCITAPPALQQLPSVCPVSTGEPITANCDQHTRSADLLTRPRARLTVPSSRASLSALAQRYGATLPGFALFAGWVVYIEGSPEFRANWTDLLSVVGCTVPNQRQLSSQLRSHRSRKASPYQGLLRCDAVLTDSPPESGSRGDGKGGKASVVSQLVNSAHSFLYPCRAHTSTPAGIFPALVTLATPEDALSAVVQAQLGPPPVVTSEWFVQCLVHHQLFDWRSHALFTHHETHPSQS